MRVSTAIVSLLAAFPVLGAAVPLVTRAKLSSSSEGLSGALANDKRAEGIAGALANDKRAAWKMLPRYNGATARSCHIMIGRSSFSLVQHILVYWERWLTALQPNREPKSAVYSISFRSLLSNSFRIWQSLWYWKSAFWSYTFGRMPNCFPASLQIATLSLLLFVNYFDMVSLAWSSSSFFLSVTRYLGLSNYSWNYKLTLVSSMIHFIL